MHQLFLCFSLFFSLLEMNSRYSTSFRGRIRQRDHRLPAPDPNWVDPGIATKIEHDKMHQKFVEGLSDTEPAATVNDASTNEKPIKIETLEHAKETKLGKYSLFL